MLEKLKKNFEDAGVGPRDIPTAIVLFNGLLWTEWGCILALAIPFRPLRRVAASPAGVRIRGGLADWLGQRYPKLEKMVLDSAEKLSSHRFVRPIPEAFGQAPKDFTFAVAETVVLYNVLFPLWLPLNTKILQAYFSARKESALMRRMTSRLHDD